MRTPVHDTGRAVHHFFPSSSPSRPLRSQQQRPHATGGVRNVTAQQGGRSQSRAAPLSQTPSADHHLTLDSFRSREDMSRPISCSNRRAPARYGRFGCEDVALGGEPGPRGDVFGWPSAVGHVRPKRRRGNRRGWLRLQDFMQRCHRSLTVPPRSPVCRRHRTPPPASCETTPLL